LAEPNRPIESPSVQASLERSHVPLHARGETNCFFAAHRER
jgi:hypothetical protein